MYDLRIGIHIAVCRMLVWTSHLTFHMPHPVTGVACFVTTVIQMCLIEPIVVFLRVVSCSRRPSQFKTFIGLLLPTFEIRPDGPISVYF